MGALNAVCPDNGVAVTASGGSLVTPEDYVAKRVRVLPAIYKGEVELTFSNLDVGELSTVRAIFAAVRYTGSILWTQPGEGFDRRWRFKSFDSQYDSPRHGSARMTLLYLPGIA